MSWITPTDVTAIFPESEPSPEFVDHIQALAEECTGEVDQPSTGLIAVFTEIVYRLWRAGQINPDGLTQETIGAYSYSTGSQTGLGITREECRRLKRAVGRGDLWVQPTTRGRVETPVDHDALSDNLNEIA